MRFSSSAASLAVLVAACLPMSAGTVQIEPAKDNTLYETPSGALSNGAGQYLFAGLTGAGSSRRAVMAFDIAGNVPEGSQITGVTLRLHLSKSISGRKPVSLHKLLADWGEGASDASGEEGKGIGAMPGDATWVYTFFSTDFWPDFTFGGLFENNASATATVSGVGFYTWSSTALVDDVQTWLDDPSGNFGWIAVGDESTSSTAKRFNSRENPVVESRPTLVIEFDEPAGAAPTCAIACGGPAECDGATTTVALAATAAPDDIPLAWSWDGPCLFADPSSPITSAECAGVGTFPLTLTVSHDVNGNGIVDEDEPSSFCESFATVQDTTPPGLSLPDATALACAADGASTTGIAATAEDLCGDVSISTNMPPSLTLGRHSIAWKATDGSGNTAAGWVGIDVVDAMPPSVYCSAISAQAAINQEDDVVSDDDDGGSDARTDVELIVEINDECCLGRTSAVLDVGCAQLGVSSGQRISLECVAGSVPVCDVSIGEGGSLVVRATTAILRGSAVDCSGNSGGCDAVLCGSASSALPPPPGLPAAQPDATPNGASRRPVRAPSRR